jgi:hypothetical protein
MELITMAAETESLSLLEFIQKLITDAELRQLFADDPEQALADNGLQDVTEADVQDALVLIDDSQTADFSRNYGDSSPTIDYSGANIGSRNDYDGGDGDGGGGDSHSAAVEHISRFITNNFIDDRDTTVDNSVNQQVDTGGGDFDQDIDIDSNVASGDGAVAADDITDSNVVTGDDNVVGDGNVTGDDNIIGDDNQVVSGDDNTTSFGEGDANSLDVGGDLTTGDGSGIAVGGDATVDNSDNSTNDSGNVDIDASTNDSFNDNSETDIEDSFSDNSDNSNNSDNSDNSDNSQVTTLDDPISP